MRYTVVCLLVVLGACAELGSRSRPYTEPQSGETARVRFVTNGKLHLIPNRSCKDWSSPGAGSLISANGSAPFDARKIGMPGEAPPKFTSGEVIVPAGKPLTVVFSSLFVAEASCDYSWAFVAKANEEYEVKVWHDGAGGYCRFEPKSLTHPAQRVIGNRAEDC